MKGSPTRHPFVDVDQVLRCGASRPVRRTLGVGLLEFSTRGIHSNTGARETWRLARLQSGNAVCHGAGRDGVATHVRGCHHAQQCVDVIRFGQQDFGKNRLRPPVLALLDKGQAQKLMGNPVIGVETNGLLISLDRKVGLVRIALARLQVVDQAVEKMQVGVARIELQSLVDGFAGLRQLHVGGELQGCRGPCQGFGVLDSVQVGPQGAEHLTDCLHGGLARD